MNIGERIKQRRTNLRMTQKELGKLLNVTQQMIGQWESSGNNIKLSTLGKIADALDCHVLDLLDDYSAIEYYENIDQSMQKYYESIGYEFKLIDEDNVIISHNGYGYKICFKAYEDIRLDLEDKAEEIIDKVMKDNIDTKFEL